MGGLLLLYQMTPKRKLRYKKIKHTESQIRVQFTLPSLTVPKNGFNDSLGTTLGQTKALFILPI